MAYQVGSLHLVGVGIIGRIGLDGVFQVWPSQDQGEVWYFNVFNSNNDSRFDADGVVQGGNTDGFTVVDNPSPHVYIETSTGYALRSLPNALNHKEIASRGYMWKTNDWEQVEITCYFNIVQADGDFVLSVFGRGAEFSTPMPWCPGSAYRLEVRKDGKFRFVKQQYFLQATPWNAGWVDVPDLYEPITLNGWFGVKFIIYNVDIGNGKQGVKLQFFLDPGSTNAFLKVGEYTDAGGWGGSDAACGGSADQIITWAGPLVGFSWDSAENCRFRLMSVRSINPGGNFGDPEPQPGKVLVSTTHVYRIGIAAKQTCETVILPDPNPPPPPPGGGLTTTTKRFAEIHDINKVALSTDELLLMGLGVEVPQPPPTSPEPTPPPVEEPPVEPPVEPPPTTPPATTDFFGTNVIYATKSGGRVWNSDNFSTGSTRTLGGGVREGDMVTEGDADYIITPAAGTMRFNGPVPRLYVYDSGRTKLWENIEVTAYYQLNTTTSAFASGYQGFEIGNRGQHEQETQSSQVRTYYVRHSKNGDWWRLKEEIHPNSNDVTVQSSVTFNTSTWYGMKAIFRTAADGSVRIESYRDTTDGTNGGTWTKIGDFTDTGGWNGQPPYSTRITHCDCRSVLFRSDNVSDFKLKKLTIREVDPLP